MNKKNLGHLMLDLETMGSDSNSAIVSIGAVEFDIITGECGREFYEKIDLQSCLDSGLKINASTIYWWFKQSQSSREELMKGESLPLRVVLHDFSKFMSNLGAGIQIWGNGARFDIGILEDSYAAIKEVNPWHYRNERDVRTLVAFRPEIKDNCIFSGIEHNPIDDCKYQIKYCSIIWNDLNNK